MLVIALPREVAAQSANATLRGKAPASSEVTAKNTDTGLTRRVQAGSDGYYVLVGLPPGNYRSMRARAPSRPSRWPSPRPPLWISQAVEETAPIGEVIGQRLATDRGQDIGGRRRHLAAPDRNHAADHPQLPRVRRHHAGHVVPGRRQGQYLHPQRAAQHGNDQRLHRRRRAEELRALERSHAGRAAPIRTRTRSAIRATRSRSSPSANTRSSPRTTRPSTTRSRAPRSRP